MTKKYIIKVKKENLLFAQEVSINNNKNFIDNIENLNYQGVHDILKVAVFHDNHFAIQYILENYNVSYYFSGFELIKYAILKNNNDILTNIVNNQKFIDYNNRMSEKSYFEELSLNKNIETYNIIFSLIQFNENTIIDLYNKTIINKNIFLFEYLLNKFSFLIESQDSFLLLENASLELIHKFVNLYPMFKTRNLNLLQKIFFKKRMLEEFEAVLPLFDFIENPPNDIFSFFFPDPIKLKIIEKTYKYLINQGVYKSEYLELCKFDKVKKSVHDYYLLSKIKSF